MLYNVHVSKLILCAAIALAGMPELLFAQVDRCPMGPEFCTSNGVPGIQYFWVAMALIVAFSLAKKLMRGNKAEKSEAKGIVVSLLLTTILMAVGAYFFGIGGFFFGMLSFIPLSAWLEGRSGS